MIKPKLVGLIRFEGPPPSGLGIHDRVAKSLGATYIIDVVFFFFVFLALFFCLLSSFSGMLVSRIMSDLTYVYRVICKNIRTFPYSFSDCSR